MFGNMRPRFVLQTLGGLQLAVRDDYVPVLVNQRKRLAFIAALAADPNGGIARERLLALFWPESDAERARNALHQIVFAIRRDLGDDAIISDAASVRLNPAVVESDIANFRGALRVGRFSGAIAEYRGAFLDGVFLRDAPEFERWAGEMREALAGDYARALERETDAAMSPGSARLTDAVRYARLLAAHDPLSTQNALRLMRALERSGDSAAALRHAAVHAAQLRTELQSEPGPLIEREVASGA
jgi:DNA-binding SARP family transcriptional activator